MRLLLSFILICLLFLSIDTVAQCDLSRNGAHPNAVALMKEPFFWDSIDENAPFGNDAGSGAARNFCRWRKDHPLNAPITSLNEFLESWHMPLIAWDELDTNAIHRFITTPKDVIYLINQDEATIGTAFAQFVTEGRLNPTLKTHAERSLQRQMLPIVLRNIGTPGQQNLRKERFTKMLKIIQQAKP